MIRRFLPLLFPLSLHAESPAPPPPLEVSPQNIIGTKVSHDGNRLVICQQLDPVAMAAKTEALRPPPVPAPTVTPPQLGEGEDERPLIHHFLGASVIIPDRARPELAYTFLQIHDPQAGAPPVSLWTNINFLWLTGGVLEVETADGIRHSFMLMASCGTEEVPPNLPFPEDGSPGLVIADGNPSDKQLAPLDALLERYARDRDVLRATYDARLAEGARIEAERRANPPEKKDLLIRWWRADDAARAGNAEGGAR